MKHWMMILLALSFVGVGCGGGLSEEDAGMAFSTTQQALDSTRTQAYSQASSQGGAAVDVACQGGGTVVWNNWDFGTESLTNWSSQATFQSCNWQNLTMTGTIDYEYSVQSEGNNATIRYVMKGTVNYSGSISGSCTYDVRWTFSNSGFSYKGSYCGYQAASFGGTF
jgi:hypothetical protein